MIRSLVVAMSENGVIGRENKLPWRLPEDLAYFKRVTLGHPILMGRRTYESIGRPLPGRMNIVLTRQRDFEAPGCVVVHSLDEAWDTAKGAREVSVIGGTALFRDTLPFADRIHLTEVLAQVDGDTFFPAFDRSQWQETEISRHPADARHSYPFRIAVLDRKRG